MGVVALEDKIVQQAAATVLQAIYEQDFVGFSYGFRPRKSAHDALDALTAGIVRKKVNWILDADIRGFFDHIDHEKLMRRIAAVIRDKRVWRLIGRYWRAGVMAEGVVVRSEEGTPQGGPLSPLLANLYLDALDRERENRGLRLCRYADDGNV